MVTLKTRLAGLAVLIIATVVLGVLCWVLFRMAVVVDTLPPVVGIGTNAEYSRLESAAIALGWGLLGIGAATGLVVLLRMRRSHPSVPALDQQ